MAEKWTIAFGRYLRTLRERRGLSLDDVESLSEAFPDPIRKAYLSKCENGHQSLAFSKLVALCRIYEVPPEVLAERLQLDMELEKTDAPPVEGLTFSELTELSRTALREGFAWKSYGLIRDALPRALRDPVRENYRDHAEQLAVGHMNCATVAMRLDRLQFARHEFEIAACSSALGSRYSTIAQERIAESLRRLGKLDESRVASQRAVELAESRGDSYALGYCYSIRALVASDEGEFELAAQYYEKAYRSYRTTSIRYECAKTLTNLANCYFETGRLKAARRALRESLRIAEQFGYRRSETVANILLGIIDLAEQREPTALRRLQEAADVAETLEDRVLWFRAEFQLYKHAVSSGPASEAERLRQQLAKLRAWIPADTPELAEFVELSA